jgi:D-3-phosphoglycerate dehydrogenase / 2-oxoglutarate reductase
MNLPIVAVADTAFADRHGIERDFGEAAEIRWIDLSSPEATAVSTIGADAVVVTLQRLTADVIAAFDATVRVIGRAGVGLDTIDLDAAASNRVAVFNQPAYGAPEVASHALALLLAVQRKLAPADAHVRAGWQGPVPLGQIAPLDDATVGVVGCGRIGRAFVERVRPLVREVLVYDPDLSDLPERATRIDDLDTLLARSDVLSLHVPLSTNTRDLIGRRELALLPPGAIVVNVARGGIVDEEALAELLHSGHLAGAGLDVFAEEPLPARSPLLGTPNTVLTPHVAALSDRAMQRLSHWTIGDAIQYVTSGSVSNGVLVVEPGPIQSEVPATPAVGQV